MTLALGMILGACLFGSGVAAGVLVGLHWNEVNEWLSSHCVKLAETIRHGRTENA
jgi:hypothetical protein